MFMGRSILTLNGLLNETRVLDACPVDSASRKEAVLQSLSALRQVFLRGWCGHWNWSILIWDFSAVSAKANRFQLNQLEPALKWSCDRGAMLTLAQGFIMEMPIGAAMRRQAQSASPPVSVCALQSRQLAGSWLNFVGCIWPAASQAREGQENMAEKRRITVAYGDGIGPEITEATLQILEAAGAPIETDVIEVGEPIYRRGILSGIAPQAWDAIRAKASEAGAISTGRHPSAAEARQAAREKAGGRGRILELVRIRAQSAGTRAKTDRSRQPNSGAADDHQSRCEGLSRRLAGNLLHGSLALSVFDRRPKRDLPLSTGSTPTDVSGRV
jgi:hypothetical protein